MKFNWIEDRGYYTTNYPPHGDSKIITDGDTKKNIVNRERKIAGIPDRGTRGTETKELSDRKGDKRRQSEILQKLGKKAEKLDQRDEDLSDFREDQHRLKEDHAENKKDPYLDGDGDYGDLDEAMKEMDLDRLSIEDPDEYRRQISFLDNEMEQSTELGRDVEDHEVTQWRKEKKFSQNSNGKSNTSGNKAKFFRN